MENKECPYCGQILSTHQFNHHTKNCFKNPIYIPYLTKGVSVNNTEDIEAHFLSAKLKRYDPDSFEDRNNFNIFGFVKKSV